MRGTTGLWLTYSGVYGRLAKTHRNNNENNSDSDTNNNIPLYSLIRGQLKTNAKGSCCALVYSLSRGHSDNDSDSDSDSDNDSDSDSDNDNDNDNVKYID